MNITGNKVSSCCTDCRIMGTVAKLTQPFLLVYVTVIDDNELVNHRKVTMMKLAMKHKYLRDEFDRVIPLLAYPLTVLA